MPPHSRRLVLAACTAGSLLVWRLTRPAERAPATPEPVEHLGFADASAPRPTHRALVLAICCASLFIIWLDNTALNVALPTLRADLHATTAQLQWIVSAYTLVLASLLLLAGSAGDRIGRARLFRTGLALFVAGSALCSLAPSAPALIVCRMLQAVGGSMLNPAAMSIIRTTFTDPRERARAIGLWAGVVGLAMALGPVLGGFLVETLGWRAIFWLNVPVGLTTLALTVRFVPESRSPTPRRLDPIGQLLVIATLATAVYAIIEAPAVGWRSPQTLLLLLFSGGAAWALVRYELRRRQPLLDPRLFRSASLAGAAVTAVTAFAALGGFLFLTSLYLQTVRGLDPLSAGLQTLPMAGVTVVVAPVSGWIAGRSGARAPLVVGGAAIAVSALLLVELDAGASTGRLVTSYVLFGIGFGCVNPPLTDAAVSGMPQEQAGVAAAIASSSRQLGLTLGVAIAGAVAVPTVGLAQAAAVAQASHAGWWLIAASGVLIAALGVASTSRRAPRAHEAAPRRLVVG